MSRHPSGHVKTILIMAAVKGLSVADVVEQYGIKRATIYDLCRRYAIKLPRSKYVQSKKKA